MTARSNHRYILPVLVIVAAVMRLPGLGSAPPPLNQDEASRGYDAWCILETGADRHGQRWPLFLESFGQGDFTAALTTYLTVPFVALLGPGEWSTRLPDALFGVLTVALLFVFLRRTLDIGAATAGALILAVDPWHISLCRTGHESGFAPFFLMMALFASQRGDLLSEDESDTLASSDTPRRRAIWAFVAGVMLAWHTWIYPATRLFTPLFLVALLLIYGSRWFQRGSDRRRHVSVAAAFLGLVLGAAPIWLTALTHPERVAARAPVTIVAQENLTVTDYVTILTGNFASNLSPKYFFMRFEDITGVDMQGVGLHLIVTAPLFVAGLIQIVIGCRTQRWRRLLVAWLMLYPIPAAICVDWNPHAMRTVSGMLWYPLVTALGWQGVRLLAAAWTPGRLRVVTTAAIAALMVNAVYFADVYFRRMPQHLELGYQTALVRAMQFAGARADKADFVLVTHWFNQPYIYVLLYAPISPRELADLPRITGPDILGFHQVNQIGKYFLPPREPEKTPELTLAFQTAFDRLPPDAEGLVVEISGRFGGGKVLAAFPIGHESRGGPPLEVRWWRRSEDPMPR